MSDVSRIAGGPIRGIGGAASFPERQSAARTRKRNRKPKSEQDEQDEHDESAEVVPEIEGEIESEIDESGEHPTDETTQDDSNRDAEPGLHIDIHVSSESKLGAEAFQIESLGLQLASIVDFCSADRPCEASAPNQS